MSISEKLRASARSVYRGLYRASGVTFAGDERVLHAFRMKMRSDALTAAQTITDPDGYLEQNKLGAEITVFLRKNVVQGVKTEGVEYDTFNLRFTKDTELGDNESIKDSPRVVDRKGTRIRPDVFKCCSSKE